MYDKIHYNKKKKKKEIPRGQLLVSLSSTHHSWGDFVHCSGFNPIHMLMTPNYMSSLISWTQNLSMPCMYAKSLQSCLTLCDLMDCSLPGSAVHGESPGKNTRVGCHALLQGIFPTQGGFFTTSTTWETPRTSPLKCLIDLKLNMTK